MLHSMVKPLSLQELLLVTACWYLASSITRHIVSMLQNLSLTWSNVFKFWSAGIRSPHSLYFLATLGHCKFAGISTISDLFRTSEFP